MANGWVTVSREEVFADTGIGGFEDQWETVPAPEVRGLVGELGAAVGRGGINVGRGLLGTAETFSPVGMFAEIAAKAKGVEHPYEQLMEPMAAAREKIAPTRIDPLGWAVNLIGETLPYMAASMAGGYGVGLAGMGLTGFAVEGQLAYEEAKGKGASEAEAQTDRMIVGTINAALESLQASRILKLHKTGKGSLKSIVDAARNKAWKEMKERGVGFTADVLKTAVEEGFEEAAQEGVSVAVPGLTRGEWPRKPDGSVDLEGIIARVGGAGLGGAVAGGVLGGGGVAVGAGVEAAVPTRARIEAAAKKIQESNLGDFQKARALESLKGLLPIEEQVTMPEEPGKVTEPARPEAAEKGLTEAEHEALDLYRGFGAEKANKALRADGQPAEPHIKEAMPLWDSAIAKLPKHKGTVYRKQYSDEVDIPTGIGQEWTDKGYLAAGVDKTDVTTSYSGDTLLEIEATNAAQVAPNEVVFPKGTQFKITSIDRSNPDLTIIKATEIAPAEKGKPEVPGIVQQEQTPGDPFEISDSAKRRMGVAKKFESVLTELEAKRPELRKETEEKIGQKLTAIKETYNALLEQEVDPVYASRAARKQAKDFARTYIPELQETISRDEVADLMWAIHGSDLSRGSVATLMTFFEDILAGRQPAKSNIKAFDMFFGTDVVKKGKIKRPKTKGQKAISIATEPFNFIKALVCSMDFSAGGIQALMVLPSHPVVWGKNVGGGYRAFFSPEYVNLAELEMKTNPYFRVIQELDPGFITEIGSKTKGEEYFVSELAHKIPIVGIGVRASDRAFVTTLNGIRTNLFYQWMEQNPGASNVQIKEILDHISNLTGRGRGKPGGKFEKYAPELGAILWAPRLYLGTVKSMTDLATKPHIRKTVAGDLVRATAFLLSILGLASLLPDTEVETDPRSTDFGKIRHGNTRLDFFGRHLQIIRLVAMFIRGEKKSVSTGRIHDKPRLEIAAQYLRSKLNPMAGIGWDVATGKTFLGEQMKLAEPKFLSKYVYEHVTPMFLQDVADAIRYQGLNTALWTSPLGLHGIGMQTYEIHAGGESARLKDHYAHMYYGTDWDQLGPETQQALRDTQPLIELYEDRARIEQSKYLYEDWTQAEQRKAGQRVLKGLNKDIQAELSRLEIPFGGLSRRLSTNWFLNEERYKEYQEGTRKLLNEVLPNIIKSPGWSELSSTMQRDILDEMIEECKKNVRQRIVSNAKIEDVQRAMEAVGAY